MSSPTIPTFTLFSSLPSHLRNKIWLVSLPTTTTIHITESADLDVTAISPSPGQSLACKESRAAYLAAGYKPYSIYTTSDWEDIYVNPATTLEVVISPSEKTGANLAISWAELGIVLHDALKAVKKVHFVCSKPERLVRLWIGVGEGLIRPGASHWDEDYFQ
jgi:hypothetical protein